MLHRDVKSMNIFIVGSLEGGSAPAGAPPPPPPQFRLGDVGVSKVLEEGRSHASTLIGTPYYLSPELAQVGRGLIAVGVSVCAGALGVGRWQSGWVGHGSVVRRMWQKGKLRILVGLQPARRATEAQGPAPRSRSLASPPTALRCPAPVPQELPYGPPSDMWALGVLLYECATRKHPFDGQSQVGAASGGGSLRWGSRAEPKQSLHRRARVIPPCSAGCAIPGPD
jgi:serine/threonine protein kinase